MYKTSMLIGEFNPLSSTGFVTPVLIGVYCEILTCLTNYDIALEMENVALVTNLHVRLFFLTLSLIGSIHDWILNLSNCQVVLIGVNDHCESSVNISKKIKLQRNKCFLLEGSIFKRFDRCHFDVNVTKWNVMDCSRDDFDIYVQNLIEYCRTGKTKRDHCVFPTMHCLQRNMLYR